MDGLKNKNNLFLCQALWVRPKGGISGGLVLSNWSLLGCAQKQLHGTEVQNELQLHLAIDDLGFPLSKLKEDSKSQRRCRKGC